MNVENFHEAGGSHESDAHREINHDPLHEYNFEEKLENVKLQDHDGEFQSNSGKKGYYKGTLLNGERHGHGKFIIEFLNSQKLVEKVEFEGDWKRNF